MQTRLTFLACISTLMVLSTACSSAGSSPHTTSSDSPSTTTPARETPPPSTPSPVATSNNTVEATTPANVASTAPQATDGPAVAKYGRRKVQAALDLAARLAYYGVADPHLLGVQAVHSDIRDYADVTRYLTPQGIADLRSYIARQTTNAKANEQAATLALANLTRLPSGVALTDGRGGLRLDKPFRVASYTAAIDPNVTIAGDGKTMTVNGRCSVQLFGHRGSTPVFISFGRSFFTYFITDAPSAAYPVGVSGWKSASTTGVKPR